MFPACNKVNHVIHGSHRVISLTLNLFDNLNKKSEVDKKCINDLQSPPIYNKNRLDQEWNNGLATTWVLFKLAFVVAMLAQSPDSHLIETGNCKDTDRQALSQNGEKYPRINFIGIVRAGNVIEQPSERIGCRHRNLALF